MGRHRLLVNRFAPHLMVAALFLLSACFTVPVDQRGNLPEPDKLSQILPGTTDKATVTQLLGSPSSVAAFDGDTWYYISQKTKSVAFFKPDMLDQQVLAIDFDDKGIVREVRHRDLADGETIVPNPNATPAPGREFSFLEQLIGNFGRFSGKDAKSTSSSGK
jgi:outer membrane protein assembly factor BamE (lipoprotein component of BamABCDE complex)